MDLDLDINMKEEVAVAPARAPVCSMQVDKVTEKFIKGSEAYRWATTIGRALVESTETLVKDAKVTPLLQTKVLKTFDMVMRRRLQTSVTEDLTFHAKNMKTFNVVDGIWTLVLEDVEFRETYNLTGASGTDTTPSGERTIKNVKIVALPY